MACSRIDEANDVMAAMKKGGAVAVIVQPSPFTYRHRKPLIESAMNHRLATIFGFPPAAREGALMAFGPDYADLYRRAALYIDRVLKGPNRPTCLSNSRPRYDLIINLKTAKALGLTIQPALLLRADQVIG